MGPEKETAMFLPVIVSFLICLLTPSLSVYYLLGRQRVTQLWRRQTCQEASASVKCEELDGGSVECLAGIAGHLL